jgi:hypothetical protein
MQARAIALTLSCLALLASAPVVAQAEAESVQLREGASCKRNKTATDAGETHRCFFAPRAFGKRDFSKPNGRAQYVFSTLGPDCKEIELLGDEPFEATGGKETLQRMSIACIR